jgi:hypothetical protein
MWTSAEDAVLRRVYPTRGWLACSLEMPGRGRREIQKRAHALGIRVVTDKAPRIGDARKANLIKGRQMKRAEKWATAADLDEMPW